MLPNGAARIGVFRYRGQIGVLPARFTLPGGGSASHLLDHLRPLREGRLGSKFSNSSARLRPMALLCGFYVKGVSCVVLYGPHPGRNVEISNISNKYSKRRNFDLQISSRPKIKAIKKSNPHAPR